MFKYSQLYSIPILHIKIPSSWDKVVRRRECFRSTDLWVMVPARSVCTTLLIFICNTKTFKIRIRCCYQGVLQKFILGRVGFYNIFIEVFLCAFYLKLPCLVSNLYFIHILRTFWMIVGNFYTDFPL